MRARRLFFALAFGLVVMVIAYVGLRLAEARFFPEADPAIIIWSERSRYGWRVLIAGYLGGAATFLGYALALRSALVASRALRSLVALSALLLFLQGALVP